MRFKAVFWLWLVLALITSGASAQEFITNGGFETGSFSGWNVYLTGQGMFGINSSTLSPNGIFTVQAPVQGTYAAMSDQTGPGTSIIYQDITLPADVVSAMLTGSVSVQNRYGTFYLGSNLDYNIGTAGYNEQMRIDIVSPSADLLNTSGVMLNVFTTRPGDPVSSPYAGVSADLARFAGQTVRLRVAVVANMYYFQGGVDALSLAVVRSQRLSFTSLPASVVYGSADFDPGAATNSGLPITLVSDNPAVATIVDGKVHVVGSGTANITASQAGNADFTAGSASQLLTVSKAPQTVTIAAAAVTTWGDPDFGAVATADSGQPVTYASDNEAVATVSPLGMIHIVGAGSAKITASQAGGANLQAAQAQLALTVHKKQLTVTADNARKDAGQPNPAFTAIYSGFVKGESAAVVTGSPTFATDAVDDSPAGSYAIRPDVSALAADNYSFVAANGTLAVGLASQTITFNPLPAKTYGDPTFQLSVTGGASGNPVTFTSSDPHVATVAGTTVTIVGAGSATITASQDGTPDRFASATAQQTLTVKKAPLTVTADSMQRPVNSANPVFTATYAGFVNGDEASEVSGTATFTTVATPASPAGSYQIVPVVANLDADNYLFVPVNGTLAVGLLPQTVQFAALPVKSYGDQAFTLEAVAGDSGNPVTFSSSNPAVATVEGTTVTIVGAGSTTITASEAGNASYAATFVQRTLTVQKAPLTVTAQDASRIYNTANPELTFAFAGFVNGEDQAVLLGAPVVSTDATVASPAGSYPIRIAAGNLYAGNYELGFVPGTLTVAKATPAITWSNPADIVYGTQLGASQLNIIVNLPGTVVANPPAGTVLAAGSGQTLSVSFTPTDTANYTNASASVIINVVKAGQSLTFPQLPSKMIGDLPFQLSASSSSNLAVSFASSNLSVATVTPSGLVTVVGVGSAIITASQPGGGNYTAAASIDRTLTVTHSTIPPVIKLSTLLDGATTTDPLLNVSGTASSANGIASVTIDGTYVPVAADGSFSYPVPLAAGSNTVFVTATDTVALATTASRAVSLQKALPKASIASPADNGATVNQQLIVSGLVANSGTHVSLKLNGDALQPAISDAGGTGFSGTVLLAPGMNTVEVIADDGTAVNTLKRTVILGAGFSLAITDPPLDVRSGAASYLVKGKVADNLSPVTVTVAVDGHTYTPSVADDGSFEQAVTLGTEKDYLVAVTGTDGNGNEVTTYRNIVYSKLGDQTGLDGTDLTDALNAYLIFLGKKQATLTDYRRCDVAPLGADDRPMGDGNIDIGDVVLIMRKAVGLANW